MEIERKYTIKQLPANLEGYNFHQITQGYLNTQPVMRIRQEDEHYYMTYKGDGMLSREEYNLPLNKESFYHLLPKCDGNIIKKKRVLIPLETPSFKDDFIFEENSLTIELDIFEKPFENLIIAEVEFPSLEAANNFIPPDWFLEDVTFDKRYHNSNMSRKVFN